MVRLIDADALLKRMQNDPLFDLVERYGISGVIEAEPTVDAIPVSYLASELAEIKLILKRKDISKTYREELEAEKRYLVGWINHWRWETGSGCRGWAFQPLSDDEIIKGE